jgi:predicted metalloendopeptidase
MSKAETIYTRVNISDLNEKYATFIKWDVFINNLFKEYNSTNFVNNKDEIVVMGLDYFKGLNQIFLEYKQTVKQENVLKLYSIFNFIKLTVPLLSAEYRNQFTALNEALTGSVAATRWQTCIEHTDSINGFGYALSRMFIRKTPSDTKLGAEKIIKSIKKSFIQNFPKITWMDKETRLLAEDKVNNVDELIGYPEFITNDKLLNLRLIFFSNEEFYKSV